MRATAPTNIFYLYNYGALVQRGKTIVLEISRQSRLHDFVYYYTCNSLSSFATDHHLGIFRVCSGDFYG